MSFLHRHKALTPYLLLLPGIVWLALFFVAPLGFLGYQSLQSGTFDTGYTFDWAFSNYWNAISDYHEQFVRSFVYAGIATILALLVSYPLVYWIAFRAGRWKNVFLILIVAPLFVTYLVRTLAWLNILADEGPVVGFLRDIHVLGPDGRLLATSVAVVAGITYNFLPFMALPLYVSLEQIDARLLEAAEDLYASKRQAFLRVTLPLSAPGIVAGTLLTFIPAAGDFINAQLLGTPRQYMVGNVIQSKFLDVLDYPSAAALSFILMALILVGLLAYARAVGTERLTGVMRWVKRHLLPAYALLAFCYLLLPIAVVILFSFNAPSGRYNYVWEGFTLDNWIHWDAPSGIQSAVVKSLEIGIVSTICATVLGTLLALAIVRHRFRGRGATNMLIFLPMSTPEIVLGASLLTLFLNRQIVTGFGTIFIAHVMFIVSYVVVTVKARLIDFDRHLEEAAMDLGANEWVTFRKVTLPLLAPAILSAALLGFALSIDDFVITYFVSGPTQTFPLFVWGAARVAVPPQVNVVASAIFMIAVLVMIGNVLWGLRSRRARESMPAAVPIPEALPRAETA